MYLCSFQWKKLGIAENEEFCNDSILSPKVFWGNRPLFGIILRPSVSPKVFLKLLLLFLAIYQMLQWISVHQVLQKRTKPFVFSHGLRLVILAQHIEYSFLAS